MILFFRDYCTFFESGIRSKSLHIALQKNKQTKKKNSYQPHHKIVLKSGIALHY